MRFAEVAEAQTADHNSRSDPQAPTKRVKQQTNGDEKRRETHNFKSPTPDTQE